MKKLDPCIKYSSSQKTYIKKYLKKPNHKIWDEDDSDILKEIKERIRVILSYNQNDRCAYCGMKLNVTSEPEIEHFAPKYKHPEWMFLKANLLYSCHFCNGFKKKGKNNIIAKKDKNYKKCEFKIVHPYFDDPDDYFYYDDGVIKIKPNTPNRKKAENTINMFELNTTNLTEQRIERSNIEELYDCFSTSEVSENMILENSKRVSELVTAILTYRNI